MAETKVVNLEVKTNSESLKKQLKEAQREVEALAAKFGDTSKEAVNAAKKAAELKDAIGDAKALTDSFNPDAKFNALSGSLSGVAGGFSAVQGAMGLVGVDSKNVEATLLKVQSAMAFSEGLNSVLAAKDAFKNLGAVIGQTAIGQKLLNATQIVGATVMKALNFVMKQNPIFLIIAGITAAVAAFKYFSSSTETATEKNEKLNKVLEAQTEAMDRAAAATKRTGEQRLKLLVAQGADEETIHNQTIKNLKTEEEARQKQVDFIKDTLAVKRLALRNAYREEDEEAIKALKKEINDYRANLNEKIALKSTNINNIQVEEAAYNTKKTKEDEESTKKEKTEAEKRVENRKAENKKKRAEDEADAQERIKAERARLLNLSNLRTEALNSIIEAENNYENSKLTAQQLEIQNTQDKYFQLIEQAKQYNLDSSVLEDAKLSEIKTINDKYQKEKDEKDAELTAKKKEQDAKDLADERALTQSKLSMASDALSVLSDAVSLFGTKNEKDARNQFKINKALSLSLAIVNTARAVTAALATTNPLPGGRFIEAGIAAASGGVSIAKIAATQFSSGGASSGGGGSTPSGGGGGGSSNNQAITPNFNIVGNNGLNQLSQLKQGPIQAYVVSGQVSTAQSLDRNRVRNATL